MQESQCDTICPFFFFYPIGKRDETKKGNKKAFNLKILISAINVNRKNLNKEEDNQ